MLVTPLETLQICRIKTGDRFCRMATHYSDIAHHSSRMELSEVTVARGGARGWQGDRGGKIEGEKGTCSAQRGVTSLKHSQRIAGRRPLEFAVPPPTAWWKLARPCAAAGFTRSKPDSPAKQEHNKVNNLNILTG